MGNEPNGNACVHTRRIPRQQDDRRVRSRTESGNRISQIHWLNLKEPLSIPYKGHPELSGEGFIHKSDFERLKDKLADSDGKPYRNARNLASGSIRCLDANICKEREINFFAFNILEDMDEFPDITAASACCSL